MAKGKAAQREQARHHLTKDKFEGFTRNIKRLKQELADSTTAHAAAWKDADPMGIHPKAAKLFLDLDRMEDTKREDFLRSFDRYRAWAGWGAQPDMFEQPEEPADEPLPFQAAAPPTPEHDTEGLGEGAGEESGDLIDEVEEVEAAETGVDADGEEDEGDTEVTEDPMQGPKEFEAGREAAKSGAEAEENPHPAGTSLSLAWANGHKQGLRDKAFEEEAAAEEDRGAEVVPMTRGRSRGRRTAAEPAVVH